MTETNSPYSAATLQVVAEAAANHVAEAVGSFLYNWRKPSIAGDIVAKEVLMLFTPRELAMSIERLAQEHFQPAADAITDTIRARGVPRSWETPTFLRPGITVLADSTARFEHPCTGAPYSDTVIVRAVVYQQDDDNVALAVLFSPRFAAE